MKQPKIFLIADTHFYHYNIIKYCNRPYSSVEEMNDSLIENWNSVVGEQDKVFMLGDFCLGGKENICRMGRALKGRKHLIIGNHDRKNYSLYNEAGFEFVSKYPIVIKYNDLNLLLSHAPKFELGIPNIYGHVHNSAEFNFNVENTFCVSVEKIDYKPIELNNELIKKLKNLNKE